MHTHGDEIWVVDHTSLDLCVQLRHALIIEWYFAADQHVQYDAETPNIDFRSGVLTGLQQFWCCKIQASTESFEKRLWRKEIAEPKVDDLDITSLADQDILDLQITMYHRISVTVIQSTGDLATEFPCLFFLEPTMSNNIVEHLPTVDILEEHVPVIVGLLHIDHLANIRMVEKRN